MYQMYETQRMMMAPLRAFATLVAASIPSLGYGESHVRAGYEMLSRAGISHTRPPFAIASVEVEGNEVPVREEAVTVTPFGTLLRFNKAGADRQPKVLVVAPLSGHFATLLRGTVQTMLPEHDVYITDWHNARSVGLQHGRFGLDEYAEHVIEFLHRLGPGAHVVAVCQPAVPVLAAVAVMAESDDAAQPLSMTLMAGPVDTRSNPTSVNTLSESKPMSFFESLISDVPMTCGGAGRRVYPGFMQLTAFVSMNVERHIRAHQDLYDYLADGETEKAATIKKFYDEYFAVLDLTAEFYLETVKTVFKDHALPLGEFTYKGRKIAPAAIKRTALLTVEGENDDVCGIGQTLAAHELCSGLRPHMKRHHLQAGVGHYGVFNGKRWQKQIYPVVRNLIVSTG